MIHSDKQIRNMVNENRDSLFDTVSDRSNIQGEAMDVFPFHFRMAPVRLIKSEMKA